MSLSVVSCSRSPLHHQSMPVDTRATHYDDIHGLAHEPTDLTLGGPSPNGKSRSGVIFLAARSDTSIDNTHDRTACTVRDTLHDSNNRFTSNAMRLPCLASHTFSTLPLVLPHPIGCPHPDWRGGLSWSAAAHPAFTHLPAYRTRNRRKNTQNRRKRHGSVSLPVAHLAQGLAQRPIFKPQVRRPAPLCPPEPPAPWYLGTREPQ